MITALQENHPPAQSEVTSSTLASNAVIGTCLALQLLDASRADRQLFASMVPRIEKRFPAAMPGSTRGVLGQSSLELVAETLEGDDSRRSDHANIPRAIIGLASLVEILGDELPREMRSRIFQMCVSLVGIGDEKQIPIPASATTLMDTVFRQMVDAQ